VTDTLTKAVGDAFSAIATFVPKFIAFLAILIIGWIIAKAIAKLVDKSLERVGFDRAVERGVLKDAMAKGTYDASTIVSKLVYYALLLFVLQMAFGVFGPNAISDLLTTVVAFIPKAIVAVGILVVGVGGGLVRPMQSRWEGYLDSMGRESQNLWAQTQTAQVDAAQRRQQVPDEPQRTSWDAQSQSPLAH
jgi:hypothetical protein